jgi:signal transduction histidine kinase
MDQRRDEALQAVEDVLGLEVLRPGMGLFGALMTSAETAAVLCDPQDRVYSWNAKHLEFLSEHNDLICQGLPYATILENYFEHNSIEADPERRRVILEAAIRRHREMVEPSLFQKKDGRWLLSQIMRFRNGWALKYWIDKTRELNQSALASSELSALSDCGIISFDRDGRFRGANNRAGDIFPDAVLHFHRGARFDVEMVEVLRANLEPAELDKITPLLERDWPARAALNRPVVLRRRDGSWLQFEERVQHDGSLSLVWIDITKLLALEATNAELDNLVGQLRSAQSQAEAASRAKSQFLAVMSHELRTPLTSVTGMIDLLRKTPLDDRQRDYVDVLRESADALLGVINDILDFSKIEAGHLAIEQVGFDLPRMIEGAVRLLETRAREKGLALRFAWPEDAPRAVVGDPTRLRQVLLNLAGNAIKFTDQGEVEIRVAAWAVDGDQMRLRIAVADTGPGISEALRPRLFQVFTQGDATTSRRFGGTGLGLAICRRLIEAMGGAIGVDSAPGQGSTFWFEIAPKLAPASVPETASEPERSGPSRAARILVADDVSANRRLIEAILIHLGHGCVFAEDGRQAVEAARGEQFDAILMDLQMPEMDGLEATRAIRALPGEAGRTPIIALTADVMVGQRSEFDAAGIDAVLLKPIRWGDLQRAIDRVRR